MITDINFTDDMTPEIIHTHYSSDLSDVNTTQYSVEVNNMNDDTSVIPDTTTDIIPDITPNTTPDRTPSTIPDTTPEFYPSKDTTVTDILSSNIGSNPYASGFDEEHPLPSYRELRNAGFTDFEAKKILYGTHEMYSDKELFECLYGSDDPKAAYDAMIRKKTDEMSREIDKLIANL